MLITTTSTLPDGYRIEELFSACVVCHSVRISKEHFIKEWLQKEERNDINDAISDLVAKAPSGANAMLSVQVSTTSQQFKNGTFIYLTLMGTPAKISPSTK